MNWLLHGFRVSSARRELAALADRLGLTDPSGWAPGLLASVDQHASAVRDILDFRGGRFGVVQLAAYARGVEDVAREHGWRSPEPPEWGGPTAGDWVSLRLAGVWLLTVTGPVTVGTASGDVDPLMYFF